MIDIITKALEITRSKNTNVRILSGYNKIPTTFKLARRQLKMKSWQ